MEQVVSAKISKAIRQEKDTYNHVKGTTQKSADTSKSLKSPVKSTNQQFAPTGSAVTDREKKQILVETSLSGVGKAKSKLSSALLAKAFRIRKDSEAPVVNVEEEVTAYKTLLEGKKKFFNEFGHKDNSAKQVKLLMESKKTSVRSKAAFLLGVSRTSQNYGANESCEDVVDEDVRFLPRTRAHYSSAIPELYSPPRPTNVSVVNPFTGRLHAHHHRQLASSTSSWTDTEAGGGGAGGLGNVATTKERSDIIDAFVEGPEDVAIAALLEDEDEDEEDASVGMGGWVVDTKADTKPSRNSFHSGGNTVDDGSIKTEITAFPDTAVGDKNYFGDGARGQFFSLYHQLAKTAVSTIVADLRSDSLSTKAVSAHRGDTVAEWRSAGSPKRRAASAGRVKRANSNLELSASKSPIPQPRVTDSDTVISNLKAIRGGEGVLDRKLSVAPSSSSSTLRRNSSSISKGLASGQRFDRPPSAPVDSTVRYSTTAPLLPKTEIKASTKEGGGAGDHRQLGLTDTYMATLSSPRHRFLLRLIEDSSRTPLPIIIRQKAGDLTLNLAHRSLRDDYVTCLSEVLVDLPQLTTMDVRGNCLSEVGVTAVLQAIRQKPCLTSIDLSENVFTFDSAMVLADYLSQPKCSLTILRLSKNKIPDGVVLPVIQSLAKNESLRTLELGHNALGGANEMIIRPDSKLADQKNSVGAAIASALCSNNSLQALELQWNNIGAASIKDIGRSLHVNQCLCTLNLAYNPVKNEGAEVLGFALADNSSLTHLDLSHAAVGPRGCFMIAIGLRKNWGIRFLNLTGNPLGQDGASHLIASLNYHTGPRLEIRLHECGLDFIETNPSTGLGDMHCPSGKHVLDLTAPFNRFVFNEFVRMCSMKRGCQLRNVKYRCPPRGTVRLPRIPITFVRSRNPAEVMGQPYGPWTGASARPRHPYTEMKANNWVRCVDHLTLVDQVTNQPWEMPEDGKVEFEFYFCPRCATPIELLNATGLARLIQLLKGHAGEESNILRLCQKLVIESCQLEEIVNELREHCSHSRSMILEVICALLPCVRDTSNTEAMLRRLQIHGEDDLRDLQSVMRSMFFVSLNAFTGSYALDLSSSVDRLAAIRLAEISAEENAYVRRTMPGWKAQRHHGFTSQKKNRTCFRNESYRLVPLEQGLTDSFFAAALRDKSNGVLTFDFVSISRASERVMPITDELLHIALMTRGTRSMLSMAHLVSTALRDRRNSQFTEPAVEATTDSVSSTLTEHPSWLMPGDTSLATEEGVRRRLELVAPHLLRLLKNEHVYQMWRELQDCLAAFHIDDTVNRYVGRLCVRVINEGISDVNSQAEDVHKDQPHRHREAHSHHSGHHAHSKQHHAIGHAQHAHSKKHHHQEHHEHPEESSKNPAKVQQAACPMDVLCVFLKSPEYSVKSLGVVPREVIKDEVKFDPKTFLALQNRAIKRAEEHDAAAIAAAVARVYASAQPGDGFPEDPKGSIEGHRVSMEGRSRLNSFAPSEVSDGVRSRLGSFVESWPSPNRRSGSLLSPSALLPQLPNSDNSFSEGVLQQPKSSERTRVLQKDPATLYGSTADHLVSAHKGYVLSDSLMVFDSALVTKLPCLVWNNDDEIKEIAMNLVVQLFRSADITRDHVRVSAVSVEEAKRDEFALQTARSNLSSAISDNAIVHRVDVFIRGAPQLGHFFMQTQADILVCHSSTGTVSDDLRRYAPRDSDCCPVQFFWKTAARSTEKVTLKKVMDIQKGIQTAALRTAQSLQARDSQGDAQRGLGNRAEKPIDGSPYAFLVNGKKSGAGKASNSGQILNAEYWSRRLSAIRVAVSSLWLSASQAASLVLEFPPPGPTNAAHPSTHLGSALTGEERFREHAVVALFSRIVDLENLDSVVSLLPEEVRPKLMNRLGWLNALSILKFDGLFDLNLSIPDNRTMAVILTDLAIKEPGQNFINPLFSRKMDSPFIPGWELPAAWDEENYKGNMTPGVPARGHLVLTFVSPTLNPRLRAKWQDLHMLLAVPRGNGHDIHLADGPDEDWDDVRA